MELYLEEGNWWQQRLRKDIDYDARFDLPKNNTSKMIIEKIVPTGKYQSVRILITIPKAYAQLWFVHKL